MADYLDILSEFLADVSFDDIPGKVIDHAGLVFADTLGCIAAGSREPDMAAMRVTIGSRSSGPAVVIGDTQMRSRETAALLNASAGTYHELDEGNRYARGHPAIHVIPALLAQAAVEETDGRTFITAIILGYETAVRLGSAMRMRTGAHPHGTWGTVGAAVALGTLLGYDAKRFRTAINIATTHSILPSGVAVIEGATAALTYPGVGCRQAFLVTDILAAGLTAQHDAPTTVYGQLLSESFDPGVVMESLGVRWEIARNYFKRFACVRYAHGLLDALEKVITELPNRRLDATAIRRIEARAHIPVGRLTEAAPANPLAARVSIPFALATYIVAGDAGLGGFTQASVNDPRIRNLASKIDVVEDPNFTAQMPAKRPSQITIEFNDKRTLIASGEHIRGDPEAPLTLNELRAKFELLTAGSWPAETAEAIWRSCLNIGEHNDVSALTNQLVAAACTSACS